MKIASYIVAMLLVLGLFAGCGTTESTGLPDYIVFAGSEVGSSFYTIAVGIGDLINEHTPMTAKIESIGGGPTWLPLFETEEADLGILSSDDAHRAYRGLGGYEDPTKGQGYNVNVLQVGSPLLTGIIVKNDSEIWSISDLKGKKVPSGLGSNPSVEQNVKSLLANAGLTYDDVIPFPVVSAFGPDVKDAFVEGRIDCASASLGSGFVTELDAAVGVRFITIEATAEAVAGMQGFWAGCYTYAVEADSFPGVVDDIYVKAHDIALVCRTTLNDNVVQELMESIWENYEELADVHPILKNWEPERFASKFTIPYHPAAIDFYEKRDVWSDELEQHQNELLAKE